jgi:hypothetical protein
VLGPQAEATLCSRPGTANPAARARDSASTTGLDLDVGP